jgi:hypothetical protein
MPAVVGSARIRCSGPAAAAAYAAYLTDHEDLDGVGVDDATVTVPGMTPAGVIELAELAVHPGHASDADAAAAIAGIESSRVVWVE